VDADLEDIKGIGPAYAERLREAGVEGVGGLADADVTAVAAESGIAESRIQKWVDRARTH
jgi:predicted flap endonuclease-1-like 5' DNA nuclease